MFALEEEELFTFLQTDTTVTASERRSSEVAGESWESNFDPNKITVAWVSFIAVLTYEIMENEG